MAKPASSLYLRVGMLVLSGIALAIGFILYLTAGQFGSKADYFETYVGESIVGLDIGAAVRYRGVQIGRVTEITLAAATYDMPEARADRYAMQLVVLRFAIERSRVARIASLDDMVAAGLRARVSSQGITGVSYLEIDILDPARNPPIRVPWRPRYDYIPAVPSTFNQVTSAAEQILRRLERLDIEGLINNSAGLMGDLRRQVSDGDISRMLREAAETMDAYFAQGGDATALLVGALRYVIALHRARLAMEREGGRLDPGMTAMMRAGFGFVMHRALIEAQLRAWTAARAGALIEPLRAAQTRARAHAASAQMEAERALWRVAKAARR